MNITHSMETVELADDITSAESLLTRHDERKIEIEAREEIFGSIIATGQQMIESGRYSTEEVGHKLMFYSGYYSVVSDRYDCAVCLFICLFDYFYFNLVDNRKAGVLVGR